jgi:hypothetical protein
MTISSLPTPTLSLRALSLRVSDLTGNGPVCGGGGEDRFGGVHRRSAALAADPGVVGRQG